MCHLFSRVWQQTMSFIIPNNARPECSFCADYALQKLNRLEVIDQIRLLLSRLRVNVFGFVSHLYRSNKRNKNNKIIIGLGTDKIKVIQRGYIVFSPLEGQSRAFHSTQHTDCKHNHFRLKHFLIICQGKKYKKKPEQFST